MACSNTAVRTLAVRNEQEPGVDHTHAKQKWCSQFNLIKEKAQKPTGDYSTTVHSDQCAHVSTERDAAHSSSNSNKQSPWSEICRALKIVSTSPFAGLPCTTTMGFSGSAAATKQGKSPHPCGVWRLYSTGCSLSINSYFCRSRVSLLYYPLLLLLFILPVVDIMKSMCVTSCTTVTAGTKSTVK